MSTMDCVKVVETLSQREKNSILHVLQRDEELRHGQEKKISNLKQEINQIRMCSVLRAGDDQTKICLRCRSEMGLIFNRGALCPACKFKVCKNCQEIMFNGSWLCKLCYRQRQLKWLTGEWTASFDQNPLRKWASGTDIMRASLQLTPGTTSIDIDESPSSHGNTRQGKKVSRNGVGGPEQGRGRMDVPKEGDQLKLSELFSVLRVKKPEENVAQETQVRRITSRKYSESDSDSSSNTDEEVRSTSTAPSVTESEMEARRIESPRHLESPIPRIIEPHQAQGLHETRQRKKPIIMIESPDSKSIESLDDRLGRQDNESQRPKPPPRSPKAAARRKVKSEYIEQETVHPTARPRTKDRRSPRSDRPVEGQMTMSKSAEVQSSRQADDKDLLESASVQSDLSLHVAKTKESLDKKFEVEKSRSQASLDRRSVESDSFVRPKSKDHSSRNADNVFVESKQALKTEQTFNHMRRNNFEEKNGADSESKRSVSKSDILIKSSDIRDNKYGDKSQASNQNYLDSYSDRSIHPKHSTGSENLETAYDEEGSQQRGGSPYSVSMDSLPSSHPSPTFNRCSMSSNPDSDTDSIARPSSRPDPILELNSGDETNSNKIPDDVVVEEISKVKFRRVSKAVGQMGAIAKMSLSPSKNNSDEVSVEQRETQSRGASNLREEAGQLDSEHIYDKLIEPEVYIKQNQSQNRSSASEVTDMLIKKLERLEVERNRSRHDRSRDDRSRDGSVVELSWMNEYEAEGKDVQNFQARPIKRLPRMMTSSVASDSDRKPSEADSIEDMIDNARAQLFIETDLPPRSSETDSDGYNLTPITPFPQEMYEKRSGRYNRFAYISDDNLEVDSADDNLQDETDVKTEAHDYLVKSEHVKEESGPVLKNLGEITKDKKGNLRSMDSLDLILQEQEDLVDENDRDLDNEYQNALKFSNEDDSVKKSEEYVLSLTKITKEIDTLIDNVDGKSLPEADGKSKPEADGKSLPEADGENKAEADGESKAQRYQELQSIPCNKSTTDDTDAEVITVEEIKPVIAKNVRSKPKLQAQDTLDILLDQQGSLVDRDSQHVEFDAELIASLEENFKDTHSQQRRSPVEYAYLGIQHTVSTGQTNKMHLHGDGPIDQDDFESLAVDSKEYLHQNIENNSTIEKPTLKCTEFIQHGSSSESSDSDILSVIEEEDDETSDWSDEEIKTSEKPTQARLEICAKSTGLLAQNADINETETAEVIENLDKCVKKCELDNNGLRNKQEVNDQKLIKGKIFQKAKDMEQKMKYLNKGGTRNGVGKKTDTKGQEKYKKIHDHWMAVEKHEADILDIDEFDKGVEDIYSTEKVESEENDNSTRLKVEPTFPEHPKTIISQGYDGSMQHSETVKDNIDIDKDSEELERGKVNSDEMKNDVVEKLECSIENNEVLGDNIRHHDISTEENEVPRILSSTLIDKSNIDVSINDTNAYCHSISDISGFTNIDSSHSTTIDEKDPLASETEANDKGTEEVCKTVNTDISQKGDVSTINASDTCTSLHDIEPRCHSISELSDPIVESLPCEISSLSFNPVPSKSLDDLQKVNDEVFSSNIKVDIDDIRQRAGSHKERLTSDEIRIELKAMQQSLKMYKSEMSLQVDHSGKVTPPATMTNDPQFFKAPDKPPRLKRQTSSSSVTSSPDISAVIPKVNLDSPKSEKIPSSRDSPRTTSECSISQDDSGNVSGGSRGTTPEHRRTDSSYSQSSLPSTLSNVTDEDEDIDRIVARVQKQSKTGTNLLSVFGDSRESLASYYSDAGDIAYSNVPITGEVLFSLNYNYKTSMLEVGVKQCRNIAVADTKRRRSDPYVKTYLLPDRTRGGKRKTKVKKHTVSPTFDETLKYSLTKSELENRTLWLTVWHNDRFGRNVFLGEVTINFDYFKFDDPFPKWYPLQERMDAPPASMMVYKGDLSICIRFVPAEKLGASPATSGKQKKEGSKGQLQVMVKEARNLTGVKSNGFSDPFCKAYLLPERHKSSKQKTAVVKKDVSPVWNHTFIFEDVTLMELRERCLELTVWDYEKLTSNDFLGGVRLNLGTGVSCGKTVDWMDARGEEMSMWQAMLDRPNIWIDGALILRPNMEKRKF